jgi:hypothetical protein
LTTGFNEIGMPQHRQREALAIVREVAAANGVRSFRWYKYESNGQRAAHHPDQRPHQGRHVAGPEAAARDHLEGS